MRCHACGYDNIQGIELCENCGMDLAGLDLPEAGDGFRGRMLTDRIGDLRLTPALLVEADATVEAVVTAMRQSGHGCAYVSRDGALVGIFNERHLLSRVLQPGLDPATTPVSEVMSPDPLELSPSDPPAYAVHCMVAYGYRYLAVVDGGDVRGYVSVRNILDYIHGLERVA